MPGAGRWDCYVRDMSVHDFDVATADGGTQSLRSYAGDVLLIVNVASQCGFTPQYSGLESLFRAHRDERSEEHTSELQSRGHLVCRLLLEKKKETADLWCAGEDWVDRGPGVRRVV